MSTVKRAAFTLVELLIAMLVSGILVGVTVSTYTLIRTSMTQDNLKAASAQNARVALERMGRELRQAPEIVTNLPTSSTDTSVTQPSEVEFEDGHADDLTYKRYYLNGNILQVEVKEYYFSSAPSTRVRWNSVGGSGESPISAVISTQDIADMVQSITFYENEVFQVEIVTGDGINQSYSLKTSVEGRN